MGKCYYQVFSKVRSYKTKRLKFSKFGRAPKFKKKTRALSWVKNTISKRRRAGLEDTGQFKIIKKCR